MQKKVKSKRLTLSDFFLRDVSFLEQIEEAYQIATSKIGLHSANKEIDKILEEKWIPKVCGLEDLMSMPKDSLGRIMSTYLLYVTQDQETIHLVPPTMRFTISHPIPRHVLIKTRIQQTHDYIHILTNVDTSQVGELVIQAFYLAQKTSPLNIVHVIKNIIDYFIHDGEDFILEAIIEGLRMGLNANKNITFYRYENDLELPINEIRKKLNIEKSLNKPWSSQY
tara:strand:+ start:247 stop:918 length:672 start_codon:yes stop_codon:yes gene_type:complete